MRCGKWYSAIDSSQSVTEIAKHCLSRVAQVPVFLLILSCSSVARKKFREPMRGERVASERTESGTLKIIICGMK